MVIIVQLFTANQYPKRGNVAGIVGALKVAITHPVANAIHYTGGPERNPDHLHSPDPNTMHTKQRQVNDCHERNAQHSVAAV